MYESGWDARTTHLFFYFFEGSFSSGNGVRTGTRVKKCQQKHLYLPGCAYSILLGSSLNVN